MAERGNVKGRLENSKSQDSDDRCEWGEKLSDVQRGNKRGGRGERSGEKRRELSGDGGGGKPRLCHSRLCHR